MSDDHGKVAESLHLAEIQTAPTPEEAVAIVAAVEALRGGTPENTPHTTKRSRWEVAGRLSYPLPGEMRLEGPLWSLANRCRSL